MLTRVVDLIAASDAAGAFALAADILESGKDVRQFLKSLSGRLRDLLFVGVGAQPAGAGEMDDSPELRRQAASFSPAALLQPCRYSPMPSRRPSAATSTASCSK